MFRCVSADRATFIDEQLYCAGRRPLFQSNGRIRSSRVAEINGKRSEPRSIRRMPNHGDWKHGQKSSRREQIEPHVHRQGSDGSPRRFEFLSAEDVSNKTPQKRVRRREGPELVHQVGEGKSSSVEQWMATVSHDGERRLVKNLGFEVIGVRGWKPSRDQYVESSLAQFAQE